MSIDTRSFLFSNSVFFFSFFLFFFIFETIQFSFSRAAFHRSFDSFQCSKRLQIYCFLQPWRCGTCVWLICDFWKVGFAFFVSLAPRIDTCATIAIDLLCLRLALEKSLQNIFFHPIWLASLCLITICSLSSIHINIQFHFSSNNQYWCFLFENSTFFFFFFWSAVYEWYCLVPIVVDHLFFTWCCWWFFFFSFLVLLLAMAATPNCSSVRPPFWVVSHNKAFALSCTPAAWWLATCARCFRHWTTTTPLSNASRSRRRPTWPYRPTTTRLHWPATRRCAWCRAAGSRLPSFSTEWPIWTDWRGQDFHCTNQCQLIQVNRVERTEYNRVLVLC